MKNIIKTTLILISFALTVSCMDEIDNQVSENPQDKNLVEMTFTASFSGDTKTILNGTDVLWLPSDEIAINGQKFTTDIEVAAPSAEFSGKVEETTHYYAIYPYSAVQSRNNATYTVTLPEVQKARKGGFADGVNISATGVYGSLQYQSLDFINVLGYVKFSIDESLNNVKSLTVRSNDGWTKVWGTSADVFAWTNAYIHIPDENGLTSVKLEAEEFFEPGTYYIAICPSEFYGGLSFEFENEDGYIATRSIKQDVELKAGEIKNIGLMKNLNFKPSPEMQKTAEREALIALYESAGGESWINNDNWCTELPVSEWYGIEVNYDGYVETVDLSYNNLNGTIPDEFCNLPKLKYLILGNNENLTGNIPENIGALSSLVDLSLSWCNFSGNIPESITDLDNLECLRLSENKLTGTIPEDMGNMKSLNLLSIARNRLTGSIPASFANLLNENLRECDLYGNCLSGTIPEAIYKNEYFADFWIKMTEQNGEGIDFTGIVIKAPVFKIKDLQGNVYDIDEIYAKNEYTILFNWSTTCPYSMSYYPELLKWYDMYHSKGVEVVAYSGPAYFEDDKKVIDKYKPEWISFCCEQKYNEDPEFNWHSYLHAPKFPFVAVVDKSGYIVLNPVSDDRNDVLTLLEEKFGAGDLYESEDNSANGTYSTMQTAKYGNGINVVLMGDGYSDRLIDDGTYKEDMTTIMEAFFSMEPYKTYREYFNVYCINLVSKHEVFANNTVTALGGWFGEGTEVGGNNKLCYEYALTLEEIDESDMDDLLIIVGMNTGRVSGTCYMQSTGSQYDYSSGAAIAYFGMPDNTDLLTSLICHEAGGHGFAKLGDEYSYPENSEISEEMIAGYKSQEQYGWWKNVDFIKDYNQVKWAEFIYDTRYAAEGIGVFQGALAYMQGAYRPTEDSIMNSGEGGFNAPSREAIYYRIHKLANGPDWNYEYEDFVEYDARNRASAAQTGTALKRRANYVERTFEYTPHPVILDGSWRDAMK